jgi:hypothetical protein
MPAVTTTAPSPMAHTGASTVPGAAASASVETTLLTTCGGRAAAGLATDARRGAAARAGGRVVACVSGRKGRAREA